MQVKLRVMRGSQAGREVVLPVPKFLIGRGEECHLRPRSEAISREHCALLVEQEQVTLRDLDSKNGTFVNGERIESSRILKSGDLLQIGPLSFEVVINQTLGGVKRPVARDVKEVAERTASSNTDDLDITRWLEPTDDTDISNAVASPETRQFRLEDTNKLALETQIGPAETPENEQAAEDEESDEDKSEKRWKKSNPGKLPPRSQMSSKDSCEAAADMLKRFFNRR